MAAHYNPTRRNRNIGTSKQGHGANNRMVIPQLSAEYRECSAKIGPYVKIDRTINGRDITFIVEQTNGGCNHACSVDDIQFMLSHVPADDWVGLNTFVLRQPTRKGRMLNPVWGRLFYHADLAFSGSGMVKSGPALFLEACQIDRPMKWSTSLDRETGDELDKLRADGHRIDRIGRQYVISMDLDSVRRTQLYRTLLHEIGHWFDWLEKVETPTARGEDWSELLDRYFARPPSERETFAHRYADNLRDMLSVNGVIPFERIGE
jgi:hypothetical protein